MPAPAKGKGWSYLDPALLEEKGIPMDTNKKYANWALIAIAMLLRRVQPRLQQPLRIVSMLLTVYLLVYNGSLLVDYLLK